mmetsp:Transcript_12644/g.25264  ORF Transcript_12644/g.25264 Transcript_12644/m.25264 type:complete len:80 (-) Transcript_12644:51-290(-)
MFCRTLPKELEGVASWSIRVAPTGRPRRLLLSLSDDTVDAAWLPGTRTRREDNADAAARAERAVLLINMVDGGYEDVIC